MPSPLTLSGPEYPPGGSGRARRLVMLLHGYGADGSDLLGLAPHWAARLPETAFVAPNAPFPCEMGFGYQWFGFQDRAPEEIAAAALAAHAILDSYIDAELERRGLDESRLALVGFSQGTMMALHTAPRRPRAVAGIVGYSGQLLAAERLPAEIRSRPPVLLIHGDADPVVPHAELGRAARALQEAGIPVRTETRPGLPHSIDEIGLMRGGAFLAEAFKAAEGAAGQAAKQA